MSALEPEDLARIKVVHSELHFPLSVQAASLGFFSKRINSIVWSKGLVNKTAASINQLSAKLKPVYLVKDVTHP